MRWNSISICALVASLLISGPSLAGSGEDKAAADALFRAGRALVKQGKFSEACPKLEASQKLDPATGTLLALGDCYESNGQTASAWTAFNDARAMAKKANDQKRADEAERRAGILEPKLSKIIIEVPQDTRGSGVEVRRNGKLVEPAMFGLEVAIDPGKQTIDATAPGQQVWTTEIVVEPKPAVTTIRIPSLVDMKPAVTEYVPPPKPPPARTTPPPNPPPANSPAGMNTQQKIGLMLGAPGLIGVAIGSVFGVRAITQSRDVHDKCTLDSLSVLVCNDPALVNSYKQAGTFANVANVSLGLGIPALVVGVIVSATAPKTPPKTGVNWQITPTVTANSTSVSIVGAF